MVLDQIVKKTLDVLDIGLKKISDGFHTVATVINPQISDSSHPSVDENEKNDSSLDIVNPQITDAVTQTNIKILPESPAESLSFMYKKIGNAVGLSFENINTKILGDAPAISMGNIFQTIPKNVSYIYQLLNKD